MGLNVSRKTAKNLAFRRKIENSKPLAIKYVNLEIAPTNVNISRSLIK